MALLLSGTSIDGRVLTSIIPETTKTYTLYFPEGSNQLIRPLGGIAVAQLNIPYPGVWREEQFEKAYTWSTRYVPLRGGTNRRFVLQFRGQGILYEFHD